MLQIKILSNEVKTKPLFTMPNHMCLHLFYNIYLMKSINIQFMWKNSESKSRDTIQIFQNFQNTEKLYHHKNYKWLVKTLFF